MTPANDNSPPVRMVRFLGTLTEDGRLTPPPVDQVLRIPARLIEAARPKA